MKVALLLSGLPRAVNLGYNLSWKRLIENYDVDVYLHSWKDKSYGCDWEEVLKTYNFDSVKNITIQSPFKFTKYKEGISLPHSDKSRPLEEYDVISCFRQLPMFYSWQTIYRICNSTTIDYDVIIRSRYDINFYHQFKLEDMSLDVLNHSPGGQYFDDNLCITNKNNADRLFLNIFDDLLSMAKSKGILHSAEMSWSNLIELSTIQPVVRHDLHFNLLRENLLWWDS